MLRGLMERVPGLAFSVSYTTRSPRPGEVDGRDYRFVSPARFREMMERGELAEWTETYGHLYGTGKEDLEEIMASGRNVILDVDYRGFRAVKRAFPDAVGVFISPPSLEVLEERLRARGTEDEEELAVRLGAARELMDKAGDFDRVVVNDSVERAVEELAAIVEGSGP